MAVRWPSRVPVSPCKPSPGGDAPIRGCLTAGWNMWNLPLPAMPRLESSDQAPLNAFDFN